MIVLQTLGSGPLPRDLLALFVPELASLHSAVGRLYHGTDNAGGPNSWVLRTRGVSVLFSGIVARAERDDSAGLLLELEGEVGGQRVDRCLSRIVRLFGVT